MSRRDPEPRMLTQSQAADYCGIGIKAFKSVCPISPTQMRDGLLRYDRFRLDGWLDSLEPGLADVVPIDWVAKLKVARVGK
jgi:hypothetical protein